MRRFRAAGAALVPFETHISGVLAVPLTSFLAVITGVHVVIAAIEGAITFAVVAFVRSTRPAVLGLDAPDERSRLSRKALGGTMLVTALLLGGVISGFAATAPDGLEWSAAQAAAPVADATVADVEALQETWTPMPEYATGWAPLAGLVGTVVTLLVVGAAAAAFRKRQAARQAEP